MKFSQVSAYQYVPILEHVFTGMIINTGSL